MRFYQTRKSRCSQFHIFPLIPISQNWIRFVIPYSRFHIRTVSHVPFFSCSYFIFQISLEAYSMFSNYPLGSPVRQTETRELFQLKEFHEHNRLLILHINTCNSSEKLSYKHTSFPLFNGKLALQVRSHLLWANTHAKVRVRRKVWRQISCRCYTVQSRNCPFPVGT